MNILANLWKNAPRWRFVVIAACVFTIAGLLKKYLTPSSQPPPPPSFCQTNPNDPRCQTPLPPPCTNPNDPQCRKINICSPPNNFSGSYKKDSDPANPIIALRWDAAGSNVQQYILKRKKAGEFSYKDIKQLTAQPYRYEDHVVFGNDYDYQVIADCGNNRASSNTYTVDMTPSYKITDFEVTGDKDNHSIINLDWNGVGDYDLTGFLVKRKMGKNDQQWREIEKMSASERMRIYTDRDKLFKPGMEYCYQVVPKLVDGTEGGASDVQCYTMPLPAPKNLKAERTSQGVRLTWEWPDDSLKNDVDQFVIYLWEYKRKTKSQAKKIEIPAQKEYLDKEANNPHVDYFYTVLAIDKQGREGFAAQIDVE